MRRLVALAVLSLFLAQVSGFGAMVEGECEEACDDAGHCSPACACASCGHVRTAVHPTEPAVPLPAPSEWAVRHAIGRPLAPHPAEILHVPKDPLA